MAFSWAYGVKRDRLWASIMLQESGMEVSRGVQSIA
jgi:hypothetical protein